MAKSFPRYGSILLAVLGFLSRTTAQTKRSSAPPAPSGFKLVSISVTGCKRYSPADIAAASGLQIGQNVTEDDFKKATQHLGETGAFKDVAYTYQYSGGDAKLEFQLTEADQWVPVRFENLVWFTDQELLADLRQSVPLFQGTLPASGNLADEVSNALQDLLIEHGIQGRADYLRAGPDDGPVQAIVFSVTGPIIRVHKVEFSGAAAPQLATLQGLGWTLVHQDYQRSRLFEQAEKTFPQVYQAGGYLKAKIGDPQAKVVPPQPDQNPSLINVDVTFPVESGQQYALGSIEWSGNKVFPVDKLKPLIHAQAGQPLNGVQFSRDLQAIGRLYGTLGYVAAKIDPAPSFDDAHSTVSYRLQFQEGEIYKMGDLELEGLNEHDAGRAFAKWALHKGDTYDGSYPRRYVDDTLKNDPLGQTWNVVIHEFPDPGDKTVDVTLRFEKKAPEL